MILIKNMRNIVDFCKFFDAFLPLFRSKKADFGQNLPSTTTAQVLYLKAFQRGCGRMVDFSRKLKFYRNGVIASKDKGHRWAVPTSSCTRSKVIFGCFRRHLRPVPMILYTPKVSSERLQNAIGTGAGNVSDDPKVTYLCE